MSSKKPSILPNFALKKPITVIMTLVALLVIGYISYDQISVELMPAGFTPPQLGIWVPYPNSNPQEVEEQIAKHVEEQVQTISGVRHIRSSSSSNGCWTRIRFTQESDMDIAYAQLRDRMDRIKPDLPSDIERIFIRKWSNDDDPVMWIALIQNEIYKDPYYLVEQHIKKRLERVDSVANVEIWGNKKKEQFHQL